MKRPPWTTIFTTLIILLAGIIALRLDPLNANAQRLDTRVDGRVPDAGNDQQHQQMIQAPSLPRLTTVRAIGLDTARRRLGNHFPRGRGIVAGHVEGGDTEYLADVTNLAFRAITFVPRTGPSTPFGHATATSRVIYGSTGIAPGIRTVHAFSTLGWLTESYLRLNSDLPPLQDDPIRVFNHSWISESHQGVEQLLRRVDYQIDTRDVIMAVGVNNGADSPIPAALASAYNVIAVGAINGLSSRGRTEVDGIGRSKPDLVAPGGQTSFTTPAVTAIVACLLEAAGKLDNHADIAQRSEVIKAALLAGATKPDGWTREPGRPLADRWGAGVANIDNALKILMAGRMELDDLPVVNTEPTAFTGRIVRRYGWAFDTLTNGQTRSIELKANRILGPISIMIVWNRKIHGEVIGPPFAPRDIWLPVPLLSDLDLRLIALPDVDTAPNASQTVFASSSSRVDNVEHLYIEALPPGRYRLEITRHPYPLTRQPRDQDYALAWRIELPDQQAQAAAAER
ncbi:MAG: S8 family serine peptidase [Phycisphaeraceae bacterium]